MNGRKNEQPKERKDERANERTNKLNNCTFKTVSKRQHGYHHSESGTLPHDGVWCRGAEGTAALWPTSRAPMSGSWVSGICGPGSRVSSIRVSSPLTDATKSQQCKTRDSPPAGVVAYRLNSWRMRTSPSVMTSAGALPRLSRSNALAPAASSASAGP